MIVLSALTAVLAALILMGAVSLWFAIGVEWTFGMFARAISLRQLFAVTTWWAVTMAVGAAIYCR
jgi:hypothetical protein